MTYHCSFLRKESDKYYIVYCGSFNNFLIDGRLSYKKAMSLAIKIAKKEKSMNKIDAIFIKKCNSWYDMPNFIELGKESVPNFYILKE